MNKMNWAAGEADAAMGKFDTYESLLAIMPEPIKTYGKTTAEFLELMGLETDRGAALMAAGYLDEWLKRLLEKYFVDAKAVANRALEGPLQTFAARIDMAFLTGLLPRNVHTDLHVIKRIRNKFAHHAGLLDFNTEDIARECRKLVGHGTNVDTASPGELYRRTAIASVLFIMVAEGKTAHEQAAADVPTGNRDTRIATFERMLRSHGREKMAALKEVLTGEPFVVAGKPKNVPKSPE